MRNETVKACAKLNLTLDILRKRSDGYHDLAMVMQSVDLADRITLRETDSGRIDCRCSSEQLPCDERNHAVKAAMLFFEALGEPCRGLDIEIIKSIPDAAGMAGGSSDAAAVLRCLRRWYAPEMPAELLAALALKIGSDVPYCLRGTTALAEGRGEILSDLSPLPDCSIVICKPDFPISTKELYGAVQVDKIAVHPDTQGMISALKNRDLHGISSRLANVFESVLPEKYAEVFAIKEALLHLGAVGSAMSGSGPAVFGIFEDEALAERALQSLRGSYKNTFLAHPVLSADV